MTGAEANDVFATFKECAAFVRDTTLADAVVARYVPGLLLREPTFCDASSRLGGFVAPHRYLIFSSDAQSLAEFEPEPWGMCVWRRDRRLKVIDRLAAGRITQFTLLEIPEQLLPWFATHEPNPVEQAFVGHGRELFEQLRAAAPVPELDTDRWRERLVFPVGVDDEGRPFSVYTVEEHASDEVRPRIARVLPYLAGVQRDAGFPSEAEHVLHSAVVAQRPFAARDPESPAQLLLALGELRLRLGDACAAEDDLLDAFGLLKGLGEDRLPVARTLLRIGHVYQTRGEPEAAERHYAHALRIARRVAGERSELAAVLLMSLGALYEAWGRYDDAAAHLDEAMQIERERYGSERSTTLNNLARLQHARGDVDAALATYGRIAQTTGAAGSAPDALAIAANVAELVAACGDLDDAFARLAAVVAAERRRIEDVAALAPERAQLELARAGRHRVDQCLSLALREGGDRRTRARATAELVLAGTGLAADLAARRRTAVVAAHHPAAREHLDELVALRALLAQRRLAGPGDEPVEVFHESLRRDEVRREELERQLARTIPEIARHAADDTDLSRVIADSAPVGSVVVEYVRYARFDFDAVRARGERPWGPDRYLAVVVSPDRPGEPELIDLAAAELVDGLVTAVRAAITGGPDVRAHETRDLRVRVPSPAAASPAGERLRAAIVDPLLPHLGSAQRLLLAPDGDLLRLPFGMLPMPDGRPLAEHLAVSYLSTARDVLRPSTGPGRAAGPPLVLADPDYDVGGDRGTPLGRPFGRLPGTRTEGEQVGAAVRTRPRLGGEATKSALLTGGVPTVVHIATHGFLLHEQRTVLTVDDIKPGVVVRPADPNRRMLALDDVLATPLEFEIANDDPFERLSGRGLGNPLLRSGLALAGANTWLRGAEPPDDAGNGILTAEEIIGMDLTGTALVVLSACETGLGEIRPGEGTFGLRRAFLLAGVRTLITSLWKVPDKETAELMAAFYRLLLDGRPCADALLDAQSAMRATHPEPFYWAAFVCIGEIGAPAGVAG